MATILTNDMGSVFLQPAGPNGTQFWLGCHDLGDVSESLGDVTRDFCPDPTARGKWKVMSRARGASGEITVDVTFPVGKTADYLEEIIDRNCPVGLYVNWNECGARNWPQYYDRGFVLEDAIMTARGFSNVAMAGSDGGAPTRSTRTFSFSCEKMVEYYNLVATDRACAGAAIVKAIKAASMDNCMGACGTPSYVGQVLYAIIAAVAGAEAQIYRSADYGVTWATAGAADNMPFANAENVAGLAVFPVSPTVTRVLVARTSTTAGTPAQVAYSDDNGVTFSAAINVGATNTEFFGDYQQCLFALNREHIWGCTDTGGGAAGNVYFSGDGGATWALQFSTAVDNLDVLHFADENTGAVFSASGDCWTTVDGGAHWTQQTATSLPATPVAGCLCLDSTRLWASMAAGTLWYSQNGGATFTQRTLPLPTGATAITALGAMDNIDDYVFAVVGTVTVGGNPYGAIWRTWDGGMNWTSVITPATYAQGMIAVDMVSVNNIFAGGGVTATDAVILQAAMS